MQIVLGVIEQSTGSLSGGVGYSQSQGLFGQVQLNESNLFGNAWDVGTNITYGNMVPWLISVSIFLGLKVTRTAVACG